MIGPLPKPMASSLPPLVALVVLVALVALVAPPTASAADIGAAADGEEYAYDDELCDRHGFGPAHGAHVYEYCKYNFGELGSLHHEEYLAGKRGCTWARETRLTLELTYENATVELTGGSDEAEKEQCRDCRRATRGTRSCSGFLSPRDDEHNHGAGHTLTATTVPWSPRFRPLLTHPLAHEAGDANQRLQQRCISVPYRAAA